MTQDNDLVSRVTCPHCDDKLREAMEALEPFAAQADARKRKDIWGGVVFPQPLLLKARATLRKLKGEE